MKLAQLAYGIVFMITSAILTIFYPSLEAGKANHKWQVEKTDRRPTQDHQVGLVPS